MSSPHAKCNSVIEALFMAPAKQNNTLEGYSLIVLAFWQPRYVVLSK